MVLPNVEVGRIGTTVARPRHHRDLAMNVLQYGTAIVAIVAVTLLAVVR